MGETPPQINSKARFGRGWTDILGDLFSFTLAQASSSSIEMQSHRQQLRVRLYLPDYFYSPLTSRYAVGNINHNGTCPIDYIQGYIFSLMRA